MVDVGWKEGWERFLATYCQASATLREAMDRIGLAPRVNCLFDLDYLCRKGDAADCYWIICDGHIRVERRGGEIVLRGAGEVVGEQAFYRPASDVNHQPIRGACLRAAGNAKLLRIDRSIVEAMTSEERAVWHETLARALCHKLDQATDQRYALHGRERDLDGLIRRFVCAEGREAALAALDGGGRVQSQKTDVVLWFSDIKGFSAYATDLKPEDVAEILRLVMEIQAEEIAKAHGQIDKFMGDGLMAFWMCPDATRMATTSHSAISAALAANERVKSFFQQRSAPLDIRIGLHAGPAVFGDFGGANRIAFTCTGQTVNEAARYEQASVCSEGLPLAAVRISSSLYERVDSEAVRSRFGSRRAFADKHGIMFEIYTNNE